MKIWIATALATAACNGVFGLRETTEIDAQQFDAPIDAPAMCPPLGTAPRFSKLLHQPIVQDCSQYIPSLSGLAIATCGDVISQGPLDGRLEPSIGLESPPVATLIRHPRLTPEGDQVIVAIEMPTSGRLAMYRRNADDSWTFDADIPLLVGNFVTTGAPTRGPVRRMIVCNGTYPYEVGNDSGTWTELDTYTATDLGVVGFYQCPNLSADGLRLVFGAQHLPFETNATVMYADRPSLNARFGLAVPVEGVPGAMDPYLTADCSRIYFSGLSSVFYVQQ